MPSGNFDQAARQTPPFRAVPYCLFTVILKREALKAFQCASTVKAVMENTGKAARDASLRST